jgi:hypothetical protein
VSEGPTVISVRRRLPPDGKVYEIGRACRDLHGWRFYPVTTAHGPSRKHWESWEACLPRWVGYPNRCETEVVR